MSEYKKTCVVCGKEFTATAPNAKYCSKFCADEKAKNHAYKTYVPVQPTKRVCQKCGKEFKTKYSNKYCSDKCRNLVNKENYKKNHAREPQEKICQVCGKKIVNAYGNKKYCCERCRQKAVRDRMREDLGRTPKPRKKVKSNLAEKIKLQKETGVSYGYLTMKELHIPKIDLSAYEGMQTINERLGR